jgi:FG-GAP repeat protein
MNQERVSRPFEHIFSGITQSGFSRCVMQAVVFTMLVLLGSTVTVPARAQTTTRIQLSERILQPAGDTEEHDSFGSATAISGNTMVIGAFNADGNEVGAGAAYVFDRIGNNWVQTAKLFAADGQAEPVALFPGDFRSDSFGLTVAISRDANTIIVGAPNHNHTGKISNAGAVYVFQRANGVWSQVAELFSPHPNGQDHFGDIPGFGGIGISGDIIAVADEGNGFGALPGAVDIFTRSNGAWAFATQLLVPDDPFFLPSSLAFDGNTVAVGSSLSDAPTTFEAGVVYVFQFSEGTWSGPVTLAAADATSFSQFGSSVSVSGNSVAVGAITGQGVTGSSGNAYVFSRDEGVWSQRAELIASDGQDFDNFGVAVAIQGQTVLVGATNHMSPVTGQFDAGAAYVFRQGDSGWRQVAELSAGDGISGGQYGQAVAVQNNTLLVGASGQHPPVEGYPGGEAYLYNLNP